MASFPDDVIGHRAVEHAKVHVEIFAQAREIETERRHVPVLEGADRYLHRFAREFGGGQDAVGSQIDLRKRLEDGGHVGVVGAQQFAPDCKRAFGEGFALSEALQCNVRIRGGSQAIGDADMIGAVVLFHDGDRALEKGQPLGRPAGIAQGRSEIAEALPDIGMVLGQHFFADGQRAPQYRLGFSVAAKAHIGETEIVQGKRDLRVILAKRLLLNKDGRW